MIEYFYNKQIEDENYKSLYISLSKSFKRLDNDVQDKISGIYFIYNDNRELMYIGQSKNIASRLTTHIRGKYRNAYKISVINLDYMESSYLDSIERFLITKLKPIDNIMVDEKYDINHLDEMFPDSENINLLIKQEINNIIKPSFLIFPHNKFIVNGDFECKLFELLSSLNNTEYDILDIKK